MSDDEFNYWTEYFAKVGEASPVPPDGILLRLMNYVGELGRRLNEPSA